MEPSCPTNTQKSHTPQCLLCMWLLNMHPEVSGSLLSETAGPSEPIPSFRCKWQWRFKHLRKKSKERQNGPKWWVLAQDLGALNSGSVSGLTDLCDPWLEIPSKAYSPPVDGLSGNASCQGGESKRPWSPWCSTYSLTNVNTTRTACLTICDSTEDG